MLAKQIKNLRINAGMSQLQLAKKLNVGPSAVGMYEQGRRIPAIDTLVQMAKLFGVSLDYLIIGTEACSSFTDDNEENKRVADLEQKHAAHLEDLQKASQQAYALIDNALIQDFRDAFLHSVIFIIEK